MNSSFIWGTSTASYQIEGAAGKDGKGPSIWDIFSHTKGKVVNEDNGDTACDHYRLYKDDIKLMKELGIDAYRFSVSWPRIFPEGKGKLNPKGIDFYERVTDTLLSEQIMPWLCFYHWDLPQALQEKGGWANRDTAYWYADYAMTIAEKLGDRIEHFVTFNEPNVFTLLGNMTGTHAPGIINKETTLKAIHHVNIAHGRASSYLRSYNGGFKIGCVHSIQPIIPITDKEQDIKAAHMLDVFWNKSFADIQLLGKYPEELEEMLQPYFMEGDRKTIHQPNDFIGVNHYSNMYAKHEADSFFGFEIAETPKGLPVTGMGWEISPKAFEKQILELSERYKNLPVYITENGCGYEETPDANGEIKDFYRADFITSYIEAMQNAIDKGALVKGYFVWSLLDNFEWAEGYKKRFGIVHVDYKTLERTPKTSYYVYRDIIEKMR